MRGSFKNLTGQKFGKLLVIKKSDKSGNGVIYWDCLCECGTIKPVMAYSLTKGLTKSCGCFSHEFLRKPILNIPQICTRCNIEQPIDNYAIKDQKTGKHRTMCKDCVKIENKKYKDDNKEVLKVKYKIFVGNMSEEKKELIKQKDKKAYKEWKKNLIEDEKESLKQYQKEYKQNNKEKRNKYEKDRMEADPVYKLRHRVRLTILSSIKGKKYKKDRKTVEILGCSIPEFRNYIEKLWEPWMTWGNHGKFNGEFNFGWDLDHIIPMATVTSQEDVLRLNHYTNFQPLCSKINRHIKNDKIDYELPIIS